MIVLGLLQAVMSAIGAFVLVQWVRDPDDLAIARVCLIVCFIKLVLGDLQAVLP